MITLILTVCVASFNAQGVSLGNDNCEAAELETFKSVKACIVQMDKEIQKISRGPFQSFDWAVSCEEDKK